MRPFLYQETTLVEVRECTFQKLKNKLCMVHGMSFDDATLEAYDQHWSSLTPYEKGAVYKTALDEGHWSSLRKMAEELSDLHGLQLEAINRHVQIARLPSQVLAAFKDPKSIKLLWGKRMQLAMYRDPDALFLKANTIVQRRGVGEKLHDAKVYKELIASL